MFFFFKGWEVPAPPTVADTSDILKRRRRKRKTRDELEEEAYAAQILKERLVAQQEQSKIQFAPVVKPQPTSIRNYATDKAVVEASIALLQRRQEQQQKIVKAKQSSLTALMLFANMLESSARIEIAKKPTVSKEQQNLAALLLIAVGKDE